ncbi:MAG: hypothetical protein LBH32_12135 [Dysgonamonadaceae bacterium]|jgi:hypothetical protein|nr:hypothetical protein [Dysgonamonadaceae bacterium]
MMKKVLFLALMLCFVTFSTEAKKPEMLRYDIECAGEGIEDTYLVKVWVYAKSNKLTSDDLKKYAVHGVLFKGYAGKKEFCKEKRAMVSPEIEHDRADFFDAFFNNDKEYARYSTEIDGSMERVKVGKEYKYGMVVSVSEGALRKRLVDAGILRKLGI